MKKPRIVHLEGTKLSTINDNPLHRDQAEAYEEMIDALIKCTKMMDDLESYLIFEQLENYSKVVKLNEKSKKALIKAGVEL